MTSKSWTTYCRVRFLISSILSLGIATVILWVIIPVYDPEATLTKFTIQDGTSVFLEVELNNRNRFRGFNYTSYGWVEIFYVANNIESKELTYDWNPDIYQGFGKKIKWNYTLSIAELDDGALQKDDGHIYVSLFLIYTQKIMLWTTRTSYYQWLDAKAYLNDKFELKGNNTPFGRIQDLTMAIST